MRFEKMDWNFPGERFNGKFVYDGEEYNFVGRRHWSYSGLGRAYVTLEKSNWQGASPVTVLEGKKAETYESTCKYLSSHIEEIAKRLTNMAQTTEWSLEGKNPMRGSFFSVNRRWRFKTLETQTMFWVEGSDEKVFKYDAYAPLFKTYTDLKAYVEENIGKIKDDARHPPYREDRGDEWGPPRGW